MRRKVLREGHPEIADTMNNLADVYCHQNAYEEAEKLYQQALAIRRRELREDHPDIAVSLIGLGNVYLSQGKYEEAEDLYQQAFAISSKVLSKEHPQTATTLNNLATVYLVTPIKPYHPHEQAMELAAHFGVICSVTMEGLLWVNSQVASLPLPIKLSDHFFWR